MTKPLICIHFLCGVIAWGLEDNPGIIQTAIARHARHCTNEHCVKECKQELREAQA